MKVVLVSLLAFLSYLPAFAEEPKAAVQQAEDIKEAAAVQEEAEDKSNIIKDKKDFIIAKKEPDDKDKAKRYETYQSLIVKSVKSLEEDYWDDAVHNVVEVNDYFSKEVKKFGMDRDLKAYKELAQVMKIFTESAKLIDEDIDNPDFVYIEKMLLGAKKQNNNIKSKDDFLNDNIEILEGYINLELEYIKDIRELEEKI